MRRSGILLDVATVLSAVVLGALACLWLWSADGRWYFGHDPRCSVAWHGGGAFVNVGIGRQHFDVPGLILMALALPLPLGWAHARCARWLRHYDAARRGRCAVCGYDLRATPGRCPECGTIPPAAAVGARAIGRVPAVVGGDGAPADRPARGKRTATGERGLEIVGESTRSAFDAYLRCCAYMVGATEAAGFVVVPRWRGFDLVLAEHIRPGASSDLERAAAVEAFEGIVRPLVERRACGCPRVGPPDGGDEQQYCLVQVIERERVVVGAAAWIVWAAGDGDAAAKLARIDGKAV